MRPSRLIALLLLCLPAASVRIIQSQQTSAPPAWLASLTPEQKTLFDDANKSFSAGDFAGALPKLRRLHEQVPENDVVAKFTAEAAINTGESALAASLLDPVLRANPDDPQGLGIEAHLYGQQHDITRRDAVMDRLQKLHDSGKPVPAVAIIERNTLPDGVTVRIDDYLEPQSRFHIVLMANFYDASGQRTRRVALESDDVDQVRFRQDHPDQAAAGVRIYSMDSYGETRNAQGEVTGQTHATLCPVPGCFMTGRPGYELFRSTVLESKAPPLSTTTVPAKPSN